MVDLALPSGVLSQLRGGQGAIVEATPDHAAPPRDWSPGQILPARIESKLSDGRALLDVAGVLFQVKLPEGADAQIGQRLSVTVLRTVPQPTFLLQADETAAEAGQAGSTRVSLSPLANRLAAVLSGGSASGATPAAIEAKALIPAPVTNGAALVGPLKEAFETSGMFYESHQAEWVGGKRPLEALRQEPQARLAHETETQVLAKIAAGPSHASGDKPAADATTAAQLAKSIEAMLLPPGVAGIVDRQLDAIATQQIVWSGQVWPGQTMHWQVEEQPADGGDADDTPQWRTQLRLALPLLGSVTAQLDLRGEHLKVVIQADGSAGSAEAMRQGEDDLQLALEARGVKLGGFQVHDGDA